MFSSIIGFFISFFVKLIFAIVDNSPDWLSKRLFKRFSIGKLKTGKKELINSKCGDRGLNLHEDRDRKSVV